MNSIVHFREWWILPTWTILQQVEERLKFYDSGEAPRKNITVMEKVAAEIAQDAQNTEVVTPIKKKKRDQKQENGVEDTPDAPSSKKKRDRKREENGVEDTPEAPSSKKKKKKKKKEIDE